MQSESIDKLATALCKAQTIMPGAKKDTENPYYKSTYADLASIWEAARKPLTDNGLAVVQTNDIEGDKVVIVTTLMHISGQWISGRLALTPIKPDPQQLGSAITYGRRYALAAICGICPEDDDAEAAMHRTDSTKETKQAPAQPQHPKPSGKPISEAQAKRLYAISKTHNWTDEARAELLGRYSFASSKDITTDKYEEICGILENSTTATEAF